MKEKFRKPKLSGSFSLSVRAKLLLSYALIAMTTLAACFIGFYSFSIIEKSLKNISNQSVPAMSAAMSLAEHSSYFENSIPSLAGNLSDEERARINSDLIRRVNSISELSEIFGQGSGLSEIIELLRRDLLSLNDSAESRIDNRREADARLDNMFSIQRELNTALITALDDAAFNLEIDAEDIQLSSADALDQLVGKSLVEYSESHSLMSDLYQLLLAYKAAVLAEDVDQLDASRSNAASLVEDIRTRITHIDGEHYASGLLEAIEGFVSYSTGETSIHKERAQELQLEVEAAASRRLYEQAERDITELVSIVSSMLEVIGSDVVIATGMVRQANAEGIPRLLDPGFSSLQLILEYRANSYNFFGLLSQISQTDSSEELVPLVERLQAYTDTLTESLGPLASLENGENLVASINSLIQLGQGDGSILSLKRAELDSQAEFALIVSSSKKSLAELKEIVGRQVENSKLAVDTSSAQTLSIIELSKYLLAVFAIASLVVTILLLWLLVSRNISKRLQSVARALTDISEGKFDREINVSGHDELGQLARIVDVFREKSIENQRLQDEQQRAIEERAKRVEEKKRMEEEQRQYLEEQRQQEHEQAERERKRAECLRSDTDSLLQVVQAASKGDLTREISLKGDHPTGQLAEGLSALIESFNRVMNQITTTTDIVASGTQKIVNGNGLLSERTEQQSHNLKSTATSMADINETVNLNYSSAKNATGLASGAQEHTQKVGKIVTEAVDAMKEINDSSAEMSAIVGVIDEIAFQTNLLALNAAVEAARAGEQGRGFAVVAAEVRNLAARSGVAAREIKTLIEDSVKKVNHGVELVGKSEKTLAELLSSVRNVTEIVAEISENAENQRHGIDSVNNSLSVLEKTTEQNAEMVDQVISLSTQMAEQTVLLRDQMSFFTFNSIEEHEVIEHHSKAA